MILDANRQEATCPGPFAALPDLVPECKYSPVRMPGVWDFALFITVQTNSEYRPCIVTSELIFCDLGCQQLNMTSDTLKRFHSRFAALLFVINGFIVARGKRQRMSLPK